MKPRPVVIAHRGASGYLPEHTVPAKALAHGFGADYLEQDVVATRDGQLIVFHDLHLDSLTDVTMRFPGRARSDGRHYCIDFDLAELRTLRVTERLRSDGSGPRFPGRFPAGHGNFTLHTLAEELDFIRGMNRSTGRAAGVYTEIKDPAWHRQQGIDLGRRVLEELAAFGYRTIEDRFFVQCFDPAELERVHRDLAPDAPLIQLLEDQPLDEGRMAAIARYARGIGPDMTLFLRGSREAGASLVAQLHAHSLLVHPFTFRADALPSGFETLEELFELFFGQFGVDGVFTDFPDRAVDYLRRR